MEKKVKCPTCETFNLKENTMKIGSRYYCLNCGEGKKASVDRNTRDWDELFEYICELYNIATLTGMMFKQINDYRKDYDYTNKGILLTLQYYYEILENEVNDDYGLGIVIYYYEKAKKHFVEKKEVEKSIKGFVEDEHTRVVRIKDKNKIENKTQEISLDSIKWGEEDEDESAIY